MTAPKAHINVTGTWKQVNKAHIKVAGTWKRVNNAYIRVAGVWKKFLQSVVACTISGTLDATGTVATPTGTSRTIGVDASNSGGVSISNVQNFGSGVLQYKKGAGVYTTTAGISLTFTNGEALQMRGSAFLSGDFITFDLVDNDTGTIIGSYTITRT